MTDTDQPIRANPLIRIVRVRRLEAGGLRESIDPRWEGTLAEFLVRFPLRPNPRDLRPYFTDDLNFVFELEVWDSRIEDWWPYSDSRPITHSATTR